MYSDFEEIYLIPSEKLKLFYMRFKKKVKREFLGKSERPLMKYKLIACSYPFVDTTPSDKAVEITFLLPKNISGTALIVEINSSIISFGHLLFLLLLPSLPR